METKLLNLKGIEVGSFNMPETIFSVKPDKNFLHEIVKHYLANKHRGTACTKTRSEISGGGKKPWKQKGTGRARQGSNTSPLMPGGGRAFGPHPRDYRTEMPKKQRRAALVSALSLKAGESVVAVLDASPPTNPVMDMPALAPSSRIMM